MQSDLPTVYVIDPDPGVHASIRDLVSAMNLRCRGYASAREFFAAYTESEPGCLVLEVKIPDMSGLQIQRRLAGMGAPLALVFLTSHEDVAMAVELMRAGAIHYLLKPLRPMELLNAIQQAIDTADSRRRAAARRRRVLERIAHLTAKERQVLRLIGAGKPNRSMAEELGVSLRTIEVRRANLIKKLELKSSSSLLHFALLANRKAKRLVSVLPDPA